DLSGINNSYRRKVTIWDNWPCAGGTRCPGDHYTGRSADLAGAVRGIFINNVLNEFPQPMGPPRVFFQALGGSGDYMWHPAAFNESGSYNAWQPRLSAYEKVDGPCVQCGANDYLGWTCEAGNNKAIRYCDFTTKCMSILPCPGGCEVEPTNVPD